MRTPKVYESEKPLTKNDPEALLTKKTKKDKLAIKNKKKYPHTIQRIFCKYICAGIPIEEAALKMNVSLSRCKSWLARDHVVEYLEKLMQHSINLDAKRRKQRNEYIHSQLYTELMGKFANGSLEKLGQKNLMKFIIDFGKEIRADTPGESTKHVKHTIDIGEELSNRYKEANSARFDNNKEKIIDITIPNKLPDPSVEVIDVDQEEAVSEQQVKK
jgi:hypothetical protein